MQHSGDFTGGTAVVVEQRRSSSVAPCSARALLLKPAASWREQLHAQHSFMSHPFTRHVFERSFSVNVLSIQDFLHSFNTSMMGSAYDNIVGVCTIRVCASVTVWLHDLRQTHVNIMPHHFKQFVPKGYSYKRVTLPKCIKILLLHFSDSRFSVPTAIVLFVLPCCP